VSQTNKHQTNHFLTSIRTDQKTILWLVQELRVQLQAVQQLTVQLQLQAAQELRVQLQLQAAQELRVQLQAAQE
jgi:hypothetical protein